MDIFSIEFESLYNILFRINWIFIIILIFLILLGVWLIKKVAPFLNKKSIVIDEVELGIGNSNVKIKIENKDREIAYRIWVEMKTRIVSNTFDEENDVINEVYNSLYKFFQITREAIKDIPVERLKHSEELISLTDRVLNDGLRPHLTKWQARFRKWYLQELEKHPDKSPQEVQRTFPDYDLLVEDLIETNNRMIKYSVLMKKIAFL